MNFEANSTDLQDRDCLAIPLVSAASVFSAIQILNFLLQIRGSTWDMQLQAEPIEPQPDFNQTGGSKENSLLKHHFRFLRIWLRSLRKDLLTYSGELHNFGEIKRS